MSRELELFREHLTKERERYIITAVRTASEGTERDVAAVSRNAKAAEVIASIIKDLRLLDQSVDEFITKYLKE